MILLFIKRLVRKISIGSFPNFRQWLENNEWKFLRGGKKAWKMKSNDFPQRQPEENLLSNEKGKSLRRGDSRKKHIPTYNRIKRWC